MASRLYFAYKMFAALQDKEEKTQRHRIYARARTLNNPLLCLSECEFKQRYRLSKRSFKRLCAELKRSTNLKSSQRVTLELKVLTCLSFFATGSYQRPVGAGHHICQKTCSDYIQEVTDALIHTNIINKYIKFPDSSEARRTLSQRFYRAYGIPGVIGCIDGTHIKIVVPPKEEEHWFYSRKHCHTLNVQMICDDKCRILNVNPKFGGCNHDSFVWENSDINDHLQALHRDGERVWLLGDSGYPQRPWLMTPFHDATPGSPEARYNFYHMQARVLIENTFSRLKNRWRCLLKDRVLHYRPLKCAKIVLACSVLHNYTIDDDIEDFGVIGCIDGTHIKIVVPPKEEEHWFYSRKHCHTLNVQMICDDKCRILNVNPKFGGCNHDSFVWENSDINDHLQALHRDGERVWLLGDSGYPQRPWLMTPFHDATPGSPEARYNFYHMQARVLIENTFSRLKNRWRCLLKDRVLHYRPLKCAKIVLACSVLHNYTIDDDIEDFDMEPEPRTHSEEVYIDREATSELIRGRIARDQLVRRLQ